MSKQASFQVYKNLHKNLFSVRLRGKVIDHCPNLIVRNVTFKVSEKGRQRVIQEKRKNVHAFVTGSDYSAVSNVAVSINQDWLQQNRVEVKYNPYKQGSFYRCDTGEAVHNAECVILTHYGVFILE